MDIPLLDNTDAAFFDLVHQLLQIDDEPGPPNRRDQVRHPYRCVQLMAPYDGRELPTQAAFRRVQCRDISPRGFSFFADERPDYQYMIVALGPIPFTFLSARVVHTEARQCDDPSGYQVGCRFIDRIVIV